MLRPGFGGRFFVSLARIKLGEVGRAINKLKVNLNRRKDTIEPTLFLKRHG
jgi:hypothetical protein